MIFGRNWFLLVAVLKQHAGTSAKQLSPEALVWVEQRFFSSAWTAWGPSAPVCPEHINLSDSQLNINLPKFWGTTVGYHFHVCEPRFLSNKLAMFTGGTAGSTALRLVPSPPPSSQSPHRRSNSLANERLDHHWLVNDGITMGWLIND